MFDEPRLPPELESIIFFEALADTDFDPTNLLSVAKRVQEWILPLLFKVVIIQKTFSKLECRVIVTPKAKINLSVSGRFVKHLFISNFGLEVAHRCIRLCPNLTNLAVWSTPLPRYQNPLFWTLGHLRLTHLSVDPCVLDCLIYSSENGLFNTVTHLDIAHALPKLYLHRFLLKFPSVTHLALLATFDQSALNYALNHCHNLKVVIWLSKARRSQSSEPPRLLGRQPVQDPRLVSIQCGTIADWKAGTEGGFDMWALADNTIATRMRYVNVIPASHSTIRALGPVRPRRSSTPDSTIATVGLVTTASVFLPKIEREIFLMAFYNDLDNATNLLAVAKRVRKWLIGPVYEVIIVHPERTYPNVFTYDHIIKYQHHIRHFMFSYWPTRPSAIPRVYRFLEACSNIEHFAYFGSKFTDHILNDLYRLPVKRLAITSTSHLRNGITPQAISQAFFSRITHLNLGNPINEWSECEILLNFSALAHLAVPCNSKPQVLKTILEKVSGLKVVVCQSPGAPGTSWVVLDSFPNKLQDDRVVYLKYAYLSDWEDGARGKKDMWSFCEDLVKTRQA